MTTDTIRLETAPLSRMDGADLADHLPPGSVSFARPALPPGQLGDPGLVVAAVALSITAITGICAWLASRGRDVALEVDVKAAGMSTGFKLKVSGGSTPQQVIEQLAAHGVTVPN